MTWKATVWFNNNHSLSFTELSKPLEWRPDAVCAIEENNGKAKTQINGNKIRYVLNKKEE